MGRNDYRDESVYDTRPYHALYISDDEGDDDICVWKDAPELSDYDSVDEPLAGHVREAGVDRKEKQKHIDSYFMRARAGEKTESPEKNKKLEEIKRPQTTRASTPPRITKEIESKLADIPLSDIDSETGKLTEEAFREREVQYALSTARRSLTHMSQFLLKLEARASKTTKEGIRQTLDATVQDMNYDFNACGSDGGPPDPDHKSEIEEIKNLSNELYNRLYLIDRHWRRIAREARDAEGRSPDISILSEPDIKEWIKVELQTNNLAAEETCFYTVRDLKSSRSFFDWVMYLRKLCEFGDHPHEEAKLIELAWRFLDRNLRGPRPLNPTSIVQFIADLDGMRRSGVWAEILKDPEKQETDDAAAWKLMRRYWSSRRRRVRRKGCM
ncbi:hypothetical protein E0Z10_g2163 [Xylaria hypoxylon]|uniref:Uncharacterized protein n=1 Tax=Xylaria hypoxylon TaxID=37992 RepID=A0A4Z0ZAM8_9PEZI|nr:hypothetical protein E0Z10_g2163 [Xylaria hypoxylon]